MTFEKNSQFKYVGNILPLTEKSILAPVKNTDAINREMADT